MEIQVNLVLHYNALWAFHVLTVLFSFFPQQPPILFTDLSPTTCPASRGAEIAFSAPSISDLNMSAPSTNKSEAVQRGRVKKHRWKKVNDIWVPAIYGVGRRWQCTCGMKFGNVTEGKDKKENKDKKDPGRPLCNYTYT